MAIGGDSQQGIHSYLAVFREATWGTNPNSGATGATAIPFLTCNFKTEIKSEKLDTVGISQGFMKRVQLDKSVAGTMEMHLHPEESVLLMGVALGGGIISSSLTGAFTHSISAGNVVDTSPTAVSFNFRKGASHVFGYVGGRVNSMKISAKSGEVAKVSFDMVFKDSTIGATDIGTSLSFSSVLPFTFVNGTFRYSSSEAAAATTTSEEIITGFELTVNRNLKSDSDSRGLGSNTLRVLPATRRDVQLKVNQRFDTTTTYNRFIQATAGAVELKFTGATITADKNYEMTIRLPNVYNNTGDTEVGGSGEILMTEITYDCLMVAPFPTTTSREIGITVINNVGSYTSV